MLSLLGTSGDDGNGVDTFAASGIFVLRISKDEATAGANPESLLRMLLLVLEASRITADGDDGNGIDTFLASGIFVLKDSKDEATAGANPESLLRMLLLLVREKPSSMLLWEVLLLLAEQVEEI